MEKSATRPQASEAVPDSELKKLADEFAAQATKSVMKDDTGLDMLAIIARSVMRPKPAPSGGSMS